MDPITQFVTLKDLVTFPGQMLVAGTFAELFKRLVPSLDAGLNRLLVTAAAVTVNFIATLSQATALPGGGLGWASVILLSLINGFIIALATIKSVEFIAERKEREIGAVLAHTGAVPAAVAEAAATTKQANGKETPS